MAKSLSRPSGLVAGPARAQMSTAKGRFTTRRTYVKKIQEQAALDKHSPLGKLTVKRNAIARAMGAHERGLTSASKKAAFGRYIYGAGYAKKIGPYMRTPGSIVTQYEKQLGESEKVGKDETMHKEEVQDHDKAVAARVAKRRAIFRSSRDRADAEEKSGPARRSVSVSQAGRSKVEQDKERAMPQASGSINNVIRLRHEAAERASSVLQEEPTTDNVIQFPTSGVVEEPVSEASAVLPSDPASDNMADTSLDSFDSDVGLGEAA